jgi:osmotically-inducible protein OsmY
VTRWKSAGNKAVDKAEKMGRDLGNRAYGVVAETKALFRHEDVTDDVLVDRVRARLGRMPVHLGAIEVTAADGVVTLRGNILSEEVPKVLRAVRYVRGVKSVNDELTVQENSQQISDLQGQPQPLGAR